MTTVLVVYDPPPPYGGVRVSSVMTLENLQSYGGIDYKPLLFDTQGKSSICSVLEYVKALRSADAVLFQIGDIFSLLRKRSLLYFILGLFFRTKFIFRGFAGGLHDMMLSSGILKRSLLKLMLSKSSLVTFQTKEDYTHFTQSLSDSVRIEWFPNTRPSQSHKINPRECATRFCFIGKVCRQKGVHFIVNASRSLPNDVTIDIYGPLAGEDRIETGLDQIAIAQQVHYKGQLSPEDVPRVLKNYDCLLLPTTWAKEGHPGVILEAFSVGVPVIATRWNGIPELVDQNCGVLFEPNSASSALLQAIQDLHDNPETWQQMRNAALEKLNEFDPDVWTRKFHQMIVDTLR